jgi:hypothetical protein
LAFIKINYNSIYNLKKAIIKRVELIKKNKLIKEVLRQDFINKIKSIVIIIKINNEVYILTLIN